MVQARERYEQKTKVITFRVKLEENEKLEEVKAQTGMSNADLVLRGAGIVSVARQAKLSDIASLENRLAQLRKTAEAREKELDKMMGEEKKRRLAELGIEMQGYKLFDLGWGVDEVGYKLSIDRDTAYRYFREWGELRGQKQALEQELLRECLKRRIESDELEYYSCGLSNRPPVEHMETLRKDIGYCHHLLAAPDEITPEWRAALLTKYSSRILAEKSE